MDRKEPPERPKPSALMEFLMIVPNSFSAVLSPQRQRDPNAVLPIDDPEVYKPVLYAISSVLVFKSITTGMTKNGLIKTMIKIHHGDTVKAAASLSTIQSLGALLEFATGPLFGKLSDVYGRTFVMRLNPVVVFASNALLVRSPSLRRRHRTHTLRFAVYCQ
jgi:hypothetical protein